MLYLKTLGPPVTGGPPSRYHQDGHLVPKDWFVLVLPDDPGWKVGWNYSADASTRTLCVENHVMFFFQVMLSRQ